MPKRDGISMSVIRRLPRYYRYLTQLEQAGINRISSKELSVKMGLTASQIRQDLNCFGGFGQQGYGYIVDQLREEIGNILRLNQKQKAIVLGAGNLGQAVAAYIRFETKGFLLTGIFDNNPSIVGTKIHDELEVLDVADLETFCRKNEPIMAVLCVPQKAAKVLVDQLYALGIRNFWNFSHYNIARKYDDVVVESVHLSDSLMTLCYLMGNT
ncbi:MAG: redox-sensing transcriptional repressor Rex [Clostridiales bacterium]|nr:redox-sensing transcriptional repressor Rex [Clostridiales bacterium]